MLKTTVRLNYNYGFKWFEKDHLNVKGWVIDEYGKSYRDGDLVDYFSSVKSVEDLKVLLARTTGHFAVIIIIDDCLIAAMDRGRSIPLYFKNEAGHVQISDSGFNLGLDYDPYSFEEYLAAGHVTQNKTLLKDISQLGAGEIGYFTKDRVDIISYFEFLPSKPIIESFDLLVNKFVEILDLDFTNLIKALNGRTVVVPLSGGYDSRSIASMLKRHGYQNVVCYSFGQDQSPEMITSRRVAETLGYRWFFIETNYNIVNGFIETEEFLRYVDYAANASSFYIIQDYFAVRKMRKEGLVPDDSVFMPGHSGDTLGGSNFLELISGKENKREMINKIINYRFDLNRASDKFLKTVHNILENQFDGVTQPAIWFDFWCMKEWNPKMFANGVRVYEFFGYNYWLPLWGKNPLLFFANIPIEQRLGKELYEYALEKEIFEPLGVNFSPNRRKQFSHKVSLFQQFKNLLKQIIPKRFIYLYLNKDYINAKIYTFEMYKSMKYKKIKLNYCGTNSVKAQWYIRYLEIKKESVNRDITSK